MAITRLGLGGSSASYPGFMAKGAQVTVVILSLKIASLSGVDLLSVSGLVSVSGLAVSGLTGTDAVVPSLVVGV